jgi:lipopolysaccharide export LptBFGC system permease protein LptF
MWRAALHVFCVGLPAFAFLMIARNRRAATSARMMGVFGFALLAFLVLGEFAGFNRLQLHYHIRSAPSR